MDEHSRVRLAPGVNYQALGEGEDAVILSMSSGYLYRCNATAVGVLDALRGEPTVRELVLQFADRHGLQPEQAREDLAQFLHVLLEEQLVLLEKQLVVKAA
jgi:hypothetical protein